MATNDREHDPDLRTALATYADRLTAIAARATTWPGRERALQLTRTADDIRHILTTGTIPTYLLTPAEAIAFEQAHAAEVNR